MRPASAYSRWNPSHEPRDYGRLLGVGQQNLAGNIAGYASVAAIEDALAYMEPPFWYYPIRQSLGSVYLRQGKLSEAEKALRDSLARVRSNGWALAGPAVPPRSALLASCYMKEMLFDWEPVPGAVNYRAGASSKP